MSDRTADIQQLLSQKDPQFQQWLDEHHRCEERLTQLVEKNEVTTDEEIEEKTLKKRKLRLKDQMAERIRDYESNRVSA